MKIAVDARTLGSRPSGVGMYLNDFLKQLMRYEDMEYELISDVAESEYIKFFEKHGIRVHTMGQQVYRSAGVYAYFSYVQKVLDEVKPDVFWEVNTVIPVRLKGNFKTMITVHDMFPLEYVEYFGHVYSMYFRHGLSKTLKHTDMILYNSNQTKETCERYFPRAKEKSCCVGYIIANPLKKAWECSDEDYFLYVGNMEKRKGVDLLLSGYRRYRQAGGGKRLILAGKMQEDDIKALVEQAVLEDENISYLDYVSHDMKHELYSKMSAFVFPSKAEGFGMPVIEVMKFNKPVIASDLPIFKEIADGVINTFRIDCDEAAQAENLAQALASYDDTVDEDIYARIVERYAPEKLGSQVHDFIVAGS